MATSTSSAPQALPPQAVVMQARSLISAAASDT